MATEIVKVAVGFRGQAGAISAEDIARIDLAQQAARQAAQDAAAAGEALAGSPWQVVSTDAATGQAQARNLTFSAVVNLDLLGAVPNFACIPYYYIREDGSGVVEEKAAPITATAMDSVSTVAVRSPAGEIEVQARAESGQLVAVNKKYLAEEFRPIKAMLAMNYPVGVANPPTAIPENQAALLPGAEARHTNPGGNRGGGIAFGVSAKINGLHHIAVGPLIEVGPRNAQDVYDLTLTGTMHSVAVGGASVVSVNNGTALGARAKVKHTNAVALGADAETAAADTVSVGNATTKRRITNAADPTGEQDVATKAYVDSALTAQIAALTARVVALEAAMPEIQAFDTLAEATAFSEARAGNIGFSREAAP